MIIDKTWKFSAKGEYLNIRCLSAKDVTEDYVAWLNDSDNKKQLWSLDPGSVTRASQMIYVEDVCQSEDRLLLGLFNNKNILIGTSGVQQVQIARKHPVMGIFIGNQNYRGKGFGCILVWSITSILFSTFDDTVKVTAGALAVNQPSVRSFIKAGFKTEGIQLKQEFREFSGWSDFVLMGCFKNDLVATDVVGISDFEVE